MVEIHQHVKNKNLFLEKFTGLVDEKESFFLKEFYSDVLKEHSSFDIITSISMKSIPVNSKILYEFMDCRSMFKNEISSITFYDLGLFQSSMVHFFFKVIKIPFKYNVLNNQEECENFLNISFNDFTFVDRLAPKILS